MSKGHLSSMQGAEYWSSDNGRQERDFVQSRRFNVKEASSALQGTGYSSDPGYHPHQHISMSGLQHSPWTERGGEPPSMVGAGRKPLPNKPGPMNARAEMIH